MAHGKELPVAADRYMTLENDIDMDLGEREMDADAMDLDTHVSFNKLR
jgi:hypothetical protein